MKTGFACLGLAVAGVITVVVSSILNGWVLSILWRWFIVPVFELPTLSIPVAIGISLFIGMITKEGKPKDDKEKDTTDLIAAVIAEAVFSPLLVLLIGWIVQLFL